MDKFPLLWQTQAVGELTVEREALYVWFQARCRLPEADLWSAWAVGEQGELRLGILEPAGDQAVIRRKFSHRMTTPLGRLLRGELRPAREPEQGWEDTATPDGLFRTPWLRRQLRGVKGVRFRREGQRLYLALPYDSTTPFPLPPVFCFAHVRRLGNQRYVLYAFDEKEWPVFPPEKN